MSLREQLHAIYTARGELTPTVVVEEARDEQHPLHARFEWDDAVAGERYRLVQARDLIRSVKVVYSPAGGVEERSVRQYQAVRTPDGYGYQPVEDVVADEVLTRIVLADMDREWKALKRRYDHFDEFRRMVLADVEAA